MNHLLLRCFIVGLAFSVASFAQAAPDKKSDLNLFYPELQVVPLASKRLEMEAQNEKSERWAQHLAIQASGVATLVAGLTLSAEDHPDYDTEKKDLAKNAALTGVVVGGGWLGVTAYMIASYSPYEDGWQEISKMPTKSEAETLARERMAEERIERAARLGRRLTWLAVGSNLAASAMMLGSAQKVAKGAAIAAGIGAFAPLVFPYHWQWVGRQHRDYKKRIYAPIASAAWFAEADGELTPGLSLNWTF